VEEAEEVAEAAVVDGHQVVLVAEDSAAVELHRLSLDRPQLSYGLKISPLLLKNSFYTFMSLQSRPVILA
jgi:hypothetical protein